MIALTLGSEGKMKIEENNWSQFSGIQTTVNQEKKLKKINKKYRKIKRNWKMQGDHGYKVVQQVPIFWGGQEDFQEWWMRFKGHVARHHFIAALSKVKEKDLPDKDGTNIDKTTEIGKKQAAAKQKKPMLWIAWLLHAEAQHWYPIYTKRSWQNGRED
jgi:hypothetical protein